MALPTESPTPVLANDAGAPLASLAPGQRGTVVGVDASTPRGRRLLELGFLPGTEISVVRRAPLGDPIAFYLRGGQICLRRSEAELISVLAIDAEAET
jgi:Fe2+ transport system protein FeoA